MDGESGGGGGGWPFLSLSAALVAPFFPQNLFFPPSLPKTSVLYGSLAVRSFDWADSDGEEDGRTAPRPATLVADAVLTPADPPSLLRPAGGGNIHTFAAAGPGPAAVLDLLAPPYSGAEDGRDCTYFAEGGGGGGGGGGCAGVEGAGGAAGTGPLPPPTSAPSWPAPDPARPTSPGARVLLHAIPAPPGFKVEHGPYRGVRAVQERAGGGGGGGAGAAAGGGRGGATTAVPPPPQQQQPARGTRRPRE